MRPAFGVFGSLEFWRLEINLLFVLCYDFLFCMDELSIFWPFEALQGFVARRRGAFDSGRPFRETSVLVMRCAGRCCRATRISRKVLTADGNREFSQFVSISQGSLVRLEASCSMPLILVTWIWKHLTIERVGKNAARCLEV